MCTFCGEPGAGLGCFNDACSATYHYLCAKTANCILISTRFIAFCPDHAHEAPEEEKQSLPENKELDEDDEDEDEEEYLEDTEVLRNKVAIASKRL